MIHVYPSLMAADQQNLNKEIQQLQPYCTGFHLDVMDNVFVPNFTWSVREVNEIAQKINNCVWVHLMVANPFAFYEQLTLQAGSLVSFHIESEIDIFGAIKIVREKKHKFSMAISPKTPIAAIVPFLNIVDQVLLMSVEPGFSGQPFLKSSLDRLNQLVEYRQQHNLFFRIGMDGGIDKNNIAMLVEKGVDDCVVGGGIFQQENSVAALQALQELVVE